MSKVRIYEYAKMNNMSSKEIITILGRMNIEVNNHMSIMEPHMIEAVDKFKLEVKSRAATAQEKRMGESGRDAVKTAVFTPNTDTSLQTVDNASHPVKNQSSRQAEQRTEQDSRAKRPERSAENQPATQEKRPERREGQQQNQNQGQNKPRQQDGKNAGRPQGDKRGPQNQRPGGNRPQGQTPMQNRPAQPKAPKPAQQNDLSGGVLSSYDDLDAGSVKRDQKIPSKRKQPSSDQGSNFRNDSSRNKGGNSGKGKNDFGNRMQGGKGRPGGKQQTGPKLADLPKSIEVDGPLTVAELAKALRRESGEVIKKLLFLGVMATINQELEVDAITLVAADYGVEVIIKEPVDQEALDMLIEDENAENLQERPPVVTIMGHVDHGKTTLLDAIRETNVTASEAGGITQHIGAYQVEINGKKITFLDTPGHAAFTSMRARGAQVTDITILVVAADDGVMPQTVEAINHAKAANVPIIVAVNKIDKPQANLDRVKQELTEHGLVAEDWGGDTIFVPVSAKERIGLEDLLEMVLLVAEVAELKADPDARSRGTVVEAELDKGRGPVATVLVQNGTLRVGDIVVAGTSFGRVRAMVNDHGRRVKEAPPSYPVEIIGLSDVPSAGDLFVVYDDERKARLLTERRTHDQRIETLNAHSRVTLDELYKQIQEGEIKDLNVIIKGDVQGSVEALTGSLEKIEVQGVRVKIIHRGVGAITESDILLATASNAIVMGFNVRPEVNAAKMAEEEQVDVRLYSVIYNAIEEIEHAMKGMLDPVYKEVTLGRAEIRQTFKISKVGSIAGCYVLEGKLTRSSQARIIRDGIVIYEGKFDTLKRFKDDVREVATGYECGASFERFNDIKEGDIIEAFVMEQIKH